MGGGGRRDRHHTLRVCISAFISLARALDYPAHVLRRDLHHFAVRVVEDGDLVRVKKALRDDDAADCVGAVVDGNLDEDGKASG